MEGTTESLVEREKTKVKKLKRKSVDPVESEKPKTLKKISKKITTKEEKTKVKKKKKRKRAVNLEAEEYNVLTSAGDSFTRRETRKKDKLRSTKHLRKGKPEYLEISGDTTTENTSESAEVITDKQQSEEHAAQAVQKLCDFDSDTDVNFYKRFASKFGADDLSDLAGLCAEIREVGE